MVLRELLGQVDLRKAKSFYIHKLTKVNIVSKNKNFVFIAF